MVKQNRIAPGVIHHIINEKHNPEKMLEYMLLEYCCIDAFKILILLHSEDG